MAAWPLFRRQAERHHLARAVFPDRLDDHAPPVIHQHAPPFPSRFSPVALSAKRLKIGLFRCQGRMLPPGENMVAVLSRNLPPPARAGETPGIFPEEPGHLQFKRPAGPWRPVVPGRAAPTWARLFRRRELRSTGMERAEGPGFRWPWTPAADAPGHQNRI